MDFYLPVFSIFVKFSSRIAIVALLLLFMGLSCLCRGAEMDVMAKLSAITSVRETGIEDANKPLAEILHKYNLALEEFQKEAQAGGDLKGVLAATAAIKQQESGTPFSPPSEDTRIAKIQQTSQRACEDVQKQIDARLLAVDREYANQLENLVKELTQEGLIDEAVKVSKMRDQLIGKYKASQAAKTTIPAASKIAERSPKPGEERDFEIAKGVSVKMCWIPSGEFSMGSPKIELGRNGDETQHRVILTKGFWLGKYEVTQEQWEAVMGVNPSHFKGKNHPVEGVSWDMIAAEGGFLEKVNHSTNGGRFDLPTEAQWEHACRAGTQTSLNNGKDITTAKGSCRNMDEVAWYKNNSNGKTHPVGGKKANAWGLHDMHGNVWEWCKDWSGVYPTEACVDPQGANSGSARVDRGGSWLNSPYGCRTAFRGGYDPTRSNNSFGFRLFRSSAP